MRHLPAILVLAVTGCGFGGSDHSGAAIGSTSQASTAQPSMQPPPPPAPPAPQPQPLQAQPPAPPPPTITITGTFSNVAFRDLNSTDPTVGLFVSFSDTQTGKSIAQATVPLSASISSGAQGVETAVLTLTTTYPNVWVTCAIVQIDPTTGAIVRFLSPQGPPVALAPQITHPI